MLALAVAVALAFTPLQKVVAQAVGNGSAAAAVAQIFAGASGNVVIGGTAYAPTVDVTAAPSFSSVAITNGTSTIQAQPATAAGAVGNVAWTDLTGLAVGTYIGPATASGTSGNSRSLTLGSYSGTTLNTATIFVDSGGQIRAPQALAVGGALTTSNLVANGTVTGARFIGSNSSAANCGTYSAPLTSPAAIGKCATAWATLNASGQVAFIFSGAPFNNVPTFACQEPGSSSVISLATTPAPGTTSETYTSSAGASDSGKVVGCITGIGN